MQIRIESLLKQLLKELVKLSFLKWLSMQKGSRRKPSEALILLNIFYYSMIEATLPDPTVLPPSRIKAGESVVWEGVFSGVFSADFFRKCSFSL